MVFQFERYLSEKDMNMTELNKDLDNPVNLKRMQDEIKAFLSETYPGIDPSVLPNNLIRLMTSANLRGSLESKAILYPDSEPQPCPTVGWFHVWNSS